MSYHIILQKIRLDTDTQINNTNDKKIFDITKSATILKTVKRNIRRYFYPTGFRSSRVEVPSLSQGRTLLWLPVQDLVSVASVGLRGDPYPQR